MEHFKHMLLSISLSSLLLSFYAEAICVPRNFSLTALSQVSSPSQSPSAQSPESTESPGSTKSLEPVSLLSSIQSALPKILPTVSSILPTFSSSTPKVDSGANHVDPLLHHLCDVTDNPSLCLSSISPLLTGAINPIAILEKQIEASNKEVQLAISEIEKVFADSSLSQDTVTCLQGCKDAYQTAIDDLNAAITAISAHDVGKLNTELSAFVTNVSDCDDGFEEACPDVENPVEEAFDKLRKLASNNLAIAQAIKI